MNIGSSCSHNDKNKRNKSPFNATAQKYLSKAAAAAAAAAAALPYEYNEKNTRNEELLEESRKSSNNIHSSHRRTTTIIPRGGQTMDNNNNNNNNIGVAAGVFVKAVRTVTYIVIGCGKLILPPVVAVTKFIVGVYAALPKDAIVAQVGLVSCFAGGYYPTLFSSLNAAQQCGWNIMIDAISDLTHEAIRVIEALDDDIPTTTTTHPSFGFHHDHLDDYRNDNEYNYNGNDDDDGDDDDDDDRTTKRNKRSRHRRSSRSRGSKTTNRSFAQKTHIVMATVDPVKINTAAGALYTTWLGVSTVLEREYARVITLSMTMARYIEIVAKFVFGPPAYLVVAEDYHPWIPVVIGWICKATAMNIAWRIQRVMTAATSAIAGGLLFAHATSRMLAKRGVRLFGLIRGNGNNDDRDNNDNNNNESTGALCEVLGFVVAGIGFYTQFEAQYRNGFSFEVPFPISLVTWPFDWAERWIQWQITK